MLVYIALILITFVFMSFKVEWNNSKGEWFSFLPGYWIAVLCIVLVAGLRDGGGVDYWSYVRIFETLGDDYYTSVKLERGFYFLNFFAAKFGLSYHFVIFITFALTMLFLFVTIRRYSPYPSLSLIIVFGSEFIFYAQNLIRQGLAASICFYSVRFIIEKRPFLFLLGISTASLFHMTALMFIPFYILAHMKIKKAILLFFIVSSIYFLYDNSLIVSFLFIVDELLFNERFLHLLKSTVVDDRELGDRPIFFSLISLLIVLFISDKLLYEDARVRVVFYFYVFFVISLNSLNGFGDMNRIVIYFIPFSAVLIPLFVYSFVGQLKRIVLYWLFSFVYFVLTAFVLFNDGNAIFPYKNLIA